MGVLRIVTDHGRGEETAQLATANDVIVRCRDADTVLAVASWRASIDRDIGVWLVIDDDYPAQLAARDLKTLAAIVPLTRVVIEAASMVDQHADVVAAMLTNDEVNLSNEVVELRGAYNRPAPPRRIDVWRYRDGDLAAGDRTLRVSRSEALEWAELTYFD
jgi:hypothetical protein